MTAQNNRTALTQAEADRRQLRKIITDVAAVADGLNAASALTMRRIDERVAGEAFRVMVVGESKGGKSTLINAMLGASILPAYGRPATAVLTEIRWSQVPAAVLHPIDRGAKVEVPVADLVKHITVPKGVQRGAQDIGPWKLAEVGWPLEILRDGVVLVDSPGLNEHPARQEVTLQNLRRADAIVFVMDSQQAVSIEEVHFMDVYLDAYDVFFVFNKINYIPDDQVAELKDDIADRLRPHRGAQHHDRYYFVNALAGLQARISADHAGWRASAVAGFVEDLTAFLADDRHRAKLIGSAREVSSEIRLLRQAIPGQRALIEQTEADLRKRYHNAQTPLRQLEIRAQQIRRELDLTQQHVRAAVRAEVADQLIRLSSQMPDIVQEIAPEQELLLRPWRVRSSAETYAGMLSERAYAELASRFNAWLKNELKGALEPAIAAMARRADELFSEFMRELATVREGLTGLDLSTDDGLSGSLVVQHIMGQIVAAYGVALIWAFTPSGFTPLIVGVLLGNAATLAFAKDKMARRIRKEIGAALSEKIRGDAPRNADKSAASVRKTLAAAIDELMSRIDAELKQLRVQVEDALSALDGGARAVEQRRQQLASWERLLETSGNAADDLIGDMALT
ncbi:MAG TPA: dynamin family protein [Streptosporangiaceae bacterium]|nr:dynamin family protein [Streptosporangiaceae bacterium]